MTDPNVVYKLGFQTLAEKLGRLPTVHDPEWLELGNNYSESYSRERDIRVAEEKAAGRPEPTRPSRKPAPQACTGDSREGGREALGGPGITTKGEGGGSEPKPPANKPPASQRAREGSRGPAGGIMAECRKCGQTFERPAKKGRPPVACERCR